jgi:hypothetical protein
LLWNLERLGFMGPMNLYVSVFWWNQRVRQGHTFPSASIDLAELTLATGDAVFLNIGGQYFGKSVFPADTAAGVAKHFEYFINGASTGVQAEASGTVLTITCRAIAAAYLFSFAAWREQPGPTNTNYTITGSLNSGGVAGLWMVDPTQSPTINRSARDWLADLLAECTARSREIVLAYSLELLNPPDDPGGGHVWAARYWDGDPVTTATGFGSNVTTHCTFMAPEFLDYQKRTYLDTAALMDAAGVTPLLTLDFVNTLYNNGGSPSTPESVAAFVNFSLACVARYANRGVVWE